MMKFRIPNLSEQIELRTLETLQDHIGGYTETWRVLTACWAQVQWLGVRSRSRLHTDDDLSPERVSGRYQFTIRSRPLPCPLRIIWCSRTFGLSTDIVALNAHFVSFIGHELFKSQ